MNIVLDISENSYSNVYSQVLPTWGLLILPDLKVSPDFYNTKEVSRGDLQE